MSSFRWFKFHFDILSERPLESKLQLGPFIHFQNSGRRCFKNISVRQQSSRPWNEICSCSVCKKKNSCSSATNERAVLFGQRFIIEFETQQQHWNTGQIRNLFSRSVRSHFPPNVGCPRQTGQTTFKWLFMTLVRLEFSKNKGKLIKLATSDFFCWLSWLLPRKLKNPRISLISFRTPLSMVSRSRGLRDWFSLSGNRSIRLIWTSNEHY